MKKTLFSLLFMAAFFNNTTMAALVQWKIENGGNGHFYEAIYAPGITWDDAEAAAELSGGYLATITSQAEQNFINGSVISNGFGYRIGGFQPPDSPEPDGNWQWVTGEPFIYTNWWPGEPSNQGGNENTIVLWGANRWNDGPATYPYSGYILETVSEPLSLSLLAPNGGEVITADSSYPVTWSNTGDINDVLIEYSTDNGATWVSVDTASNTGLYNWLVPAKDSNQCLVRISDSSNLNISDTSNAVFTLRKPVVCSQPIPGDLNGDCKVDFTDFCLLAVGWTDEEDLTSLAQLLVSWLDCNLDPPEACWN
jgi:hypothetical protein